MGTSRAIWLFVVALLVSVGSSRVAVASQVDDIVAGHLEARGGAERLAEIGTIRATGSLRQRGITMPFTLWMQRPNRVRMDLTLQGVTIVQAFDGEEAWWINPLAGAREGGRMPNNLQRSVERWVDFDGPLVDYASKGHRLEYAGESVTESGARRYELVLTLADGDEWRVFIDARSYLEVARSYTLPLGSEAREAVFNFQDFVTVDGVTLPGRIEGRGPDGVTYAMRFDTYELNPAVDESMFVMPAAKTGTPTGVIELGDMGALYERFNNDAGVVRAVILLSPN